MLPRNHPDRIKIAFTPATAARAAAPYMWPELRRIGVLTGLMLVILAVLTAVLR